MLLPVTQHTPKCLNLRQKGERKRQASIPQCPIPKPGKQSGRAKKTLQALHETEKGSTFAPQTKQDRGIAQLV